MGSEFYRADCRVCGWAYISNDRKWFEINAEGHAEENSHYVYSPDLRGNRA